MAPEGVSGGKRRDLSCGHCCLRTSSWAEMCAHLNRPGMKLQSSYQAGASLGDAPLRLLPAPTPVSVPPPVSGDAATSAAQDPSPEGLRDAASTPVRGKAAKRRRVLCSPACVTPPPLAAPRVERDAASRSPPEAYVPQVSGAGPSGGPDDADPDDPVGLLLSLLDCPPTSSPPFRDFWGAPAPEDPGLGGLVDPGAAAPADVDVFPAPVGMNPQDWEDWFTWTDPLFAEDPGSVDSFSAIEPAVLLASVAGSSPPPTPLVDAPRPSWRLWSPRRSTRPKPRLRSRARRVPRKTFRRRTACVLHLGFPCPRWFRKPTSWLLPARRKGSDDLPPRR